MRAFKEKAPFWVEKMPELPELVYDSLRQGKYLQHSVDNIARELQSNHVRQGHSRYFLGIGATLVLSGTFLLVSRPEWADARLVNGRWSDRPVCRLAQNTLIFSSLKAGV